MGMTPEQTAAQCYKTAIGGANIVKDDEMQGDAYNCLFDERLAAVSESLAKAEKETGKKVLYMLSVTDEVDRINEKARRAVRNGATGLLLTYSAGYSALKALAADPEVNVPILLHVSHMVALLPNISFTALSKFSRLCGADLTLVPTIWSSYQVASLEEGLRSVHALQQKLGDIKPTFPVPGGGLHPGLVPHLLAEYGTDIVLSAGGGMLGHPQGYTAGARAFNQAVEATLAGQELADAAEKASELKAAIDFWGIFERPKTPWGYQGTEFQPKKIQR
jgi:2,3-diketo-5-methylthiopentyl-1-phosphate enolase